MISRVVGGGSGDSDSALDIGRMESFFLVRRRLSRSVQGSYSTFIEKLLLAVFSMARMNTALGFIIPTDSSSVLTGNLSILNLWMRVISTVCLAVLTRALQPLFSGLGMFQVRERFISIVNRHAPWTPLVELYLVQIVKQVYLLDV